MSDITRLPFSPLGTDAPNVLSNSTSVAVTCCDYRPSTAAEEVRKIEYAISLAHVLKDPEFYYDPHAPSRFSAYIKDKLDSEPKKITDGILFVIDNMRKVITGDVLSDVGRAVVNKTSKYPQEMVAILAQKLIMDSDPLVVDSVVRAIDDYDANWLKASGRIKEAVSNIPWQDVREDAADTLEKHVRP